MKFKELSYEDIAGLKTDLDFSQDDARSLKIYNIYRRFYTEYLINKFELIQYDRKIINMNLPDGYLDLYKEYTSNYLKYIFVRNNLYVNNLSNEEKEYILRMENANYNQEIEDFISKTYQRVINGYGDNSYCFYGKQIKNYCVKSDMIVLGIYCDDYDLSIKEKIKELIKEIEMKSNNVKVLIYNQNTYQDVVFIR